MVKMKLRNRLHKVDNIAGATVTFQDAKAATVLTATSDAHGVASLNLKPLANGAYTCEIEAPNVSADEVGPALATTAPVPDRIYRPVTLIVKIAGGIINSAVPADPLTATVAVSASLVNVDIQPVWMKSAQSSGRGKPVSMIIVHHTACDLGPAVSTFLSEKGPHYMIDTDGQIVKWVPDARAAWHAGVARWDGHADVNERSVGIEIVNKTGPYPEAQYTALLGLLDRITTAFSGIDEWNIIGHSDVGTNSDGKLGRKSGDPGAQFEWSRLEAKRLGLLESDGPPDINIYAGFFKVVASGSLHVGDNDSRHHFDGANHKDITGHPVRELQEDLVAIGYSLGGSPDGDFGAKTQAAVTAFQEHFFAGGRGPKAPDGRVDFQTAAMIKSVAALAPALAGVP